MGLEDRPEFEQQRKCGCTISINDFKVIVAACLIHRGKWLTFIVKKVS